ncbi:MAG: hypothetical protein ACXWN0_10170 [Isosphaeraceae bacterium]
MTIMMADRIVTAKDPAGGNERRDLILEIIISPFAESSKRFSPRSVIMLSVPGDLRARPKGKRKPSRPARANFRGLILTKRVGAD